MQVGNEPATSDSLRVHKDIGYIELGVVDFRSLEIVSASWRFYGWINRDPSHRISICGIVPSVTKEAIHAALRANQGVCEVEGKFISSAKQPVTLRMRLIQTGKSEASPLRLLAFDISEFRRREEILRTVSGYLETHKNLISENRKALRALLDSLPQAVFMLDKNMRVTSEVSKRAVDFFGEDISNQSLLDITGLSSREFEALELAFSGVPWDMMSGVMPKEFTRGGRIFALTIVPLFEQQTLTAVTAIVDDITGQRTLETSLLQKDADNRALVAILESKDEFFDLIHLASKASDVIDSLSQLRPIIHSLKGGFSFLECNAFAAKCHEFEGHLTPVVYTPEQGQHFLADLSAEIAAFVSRHGQVLQASSEYADEKTKSIVRVEYNSIGAVYRRAQEARCAPELLRDIEALAEVPLSHTLSWLDKTWHRTLINGGKEGKPIVWSGDVLLAREPHKELLQSFVHIIRNAVDHGIEHPEDRILLDKNRAGRMHITSSCEGDNYRIEFQDDGAGIDPDRIILVARQRGMSVPEGMSQEDIIQLVCEPGFSSKEEITELSGCGIGLEAVRACARKLGGDVRIESQMGVGTKIIVWFKRQPCWQP